MSKFTQVQAKTDITENGRLLVRKGTKGTILRVNENPYVRFSTGKMMTIAVTMLLTL